MELIVSGYGSKPMNTLTHCSLESDQTILIKWQASIENPSYVCEGDGYLFTVTEDKDYASVYLYQRAGDGLHLLDRKLIEGGYLCHIAYSSKNKALFGACYETGTIFSIRVREGKFGDLLYQENQYGEEPQALTRAHCVLINSKETKLVTVNIALDRIYFYEITDGYMALSKVLDLPKGIGPRHAVFSENEQLLYVITEYSNEILVFDSFGSGQLVQRISTLNPEFHGVSNCSTLCFSKDRKYLYAANRGAQTICQFQVRADGTLLWLKEFDCGGEHPRHMIVSRDGRYLAVCNQNSDNITIFILDADNGELNSKAASFSFSSPSGILELI